jgi:hypothetical protein
MDHVGSLRVYRASSNREASKGQGLLVVAPDIDSRLDVCLVLLS